MQIAICDDCREDALVLRSFLDGHQVNIFSSAEDLLAEQERNNLRFDLYLLDIYMNTTINGIQLAKQIRAQNEDAGICFISSSDEFYREAYDLQDVNYLLKPVSREAFQKLIERVTRRQTRDRQQSFTYKRGSRIESIPYGSILFISSSGHALDIQCKDGGVYPYKAKLDDIAAVLDENVFLRCHQSFLVNLYQVDHLTAGELILGEYRIPISRRYYADVKRRYQEILFEEVN